MAQDDMSLLTFKILAYLYECMQQGKAASRENFKVENCFFAKGLKQEYLDLICKILEEEGYTKGFKFANTWDGSAIVISYDARLTFKGLEYLKENNLMKKAYEYLKEVKVWVPFF